VTCAANCAVDGAAYESTYGISTSGDALTLNFITQASLKNIGSRVYLMASETEYQIFNLLNQEFTFDVDLSSLPCGLNGALYFSQMDADGGTARFPTNTAGAKYGTGYCDSQCPRDLKFINGQANVEGWVPDTNDPNSGVGNHGTCCTEMDVWEANSVSAAYTPHPCTVSEQTLCTGTACGGNDSPTNRYGSVCDPDGCDFNSFRMGNKTFYGNGLTVDTSQKFTVVTQFVTNNNATTGTLNEIRRLYVQNGKVIQNSFSTFPTLAKFNSITSAFCDAQKTLTGDTNDFDTKGGIAAMSAAAKTGMVLVMSIWDDHTADMLWLDSDYPTTGNPSTPGIARGTCASTSGVPTNVETSAASAAVTFSNIKFGPIGSTFSATSSSGGSGSGTATSSSTAPSSTGTTQVEFGQCGGETWLGPTVCASGLTCVLMNPFYSQCLAA
jgi:cellulose 1,4-beta-cellobiosidase